MRFRAAGQLGLTVDLTVDGYGDGLIIVNARPRTAQSPHGGGSIVITTYGLDDAAFSRLLEGWTKWWSHTYEVIEIQPQPQAR